MARITVQSTLALGLMASLGLGALATKSVAQDEAPEIQDSRKPDPTPVVPSPQHIPDALIQMGHGDFFAPYAFVMDKSTRTLTVWKSSPTNIELITAMPADFGRSLGDKTVSGDHKTPEGIYYFLEHKQGRELNFDEYGERAFTMDYPNFFDRREGKSGNGIWLHAVPDYKSLWRGSRGCVVVRNEVIKDLSQYISLKRTPIIVQDKVTYLSPQNWQNDRDTWLKWLNSWRLSWQNKDIAQYMNHYSEDFKSMGMNKEQWQRYKENLNNKYQFIKVEVSEPVIFKHQNEMVIKFLQAYQSDKNSDFGEKTLYLQQTGDKYLVVGEEWQGLQREGIAANHQ